MVTAAPEVNPHAFVDTAWSRPEAAIRLDGAKRPGWSRHRARFRVGFRRWRKGRERVRVGRSSGSDPDAGPGHRRLCQGLPRGSRGAAGERTGLPGHPAVARAVLWSPKSHSVYRETGPGRAAARMERADGRRHRATARRPHDVGTPQPPDRPRRRHLVSRGSRQAAFHGGARERVGGLHGQPRRAVHRSPALERRCTRGC